MALTARGVAGAHRSRGLGAAFRDMRGKRARRIPLSVGNDMPPRRGREVRVRLPGGRTSGSVWAACGLSNEICGPPCQFFDDSAGRRIGGSVQSLQLPHRCAEFSFSRRHWGDVRRFLDGRTHRCGLVEEQIRSAWCCGPVVVGHSPLRSELLADGRLGASAEVPPAGDVGSRRTARRRAVLDPPMATISSRTGRRAPPRRQLAPPRLPPC